MAQLQVMLDEDGSIAGTGHFNARGAEDLTVELVALPGQKLVELEVDDDLVNIEDVEELHAKLRPLVLPAGS
jgi:hypothetical protein